MGKGQQLSNKLHAFPELCLTANPVCNTLEGVSISLAVSSCERLQVIDKSCNRRLFDLTMMVLMICLADLPLLAFSQLQGLIQSRQQVGAG